MLGLMQDWPLLASKLLDHASAWHGNRPIVARGAEGETLTSDYAGVHRRAKKVSNALYRAGIRQGDRVATLGWNSIRHLEAWYGIIGIGAVCHTLNPRLYSEHLIYIINHAADKILLADPFCAPIVADILPSCPKIERVIFFAPGHELPQLPFGAIAFDDWIEVETEDCTWGGFEENAACGLCYTSGTTGNPKGVLYSHRSNYLHALMTLQNDALRLSARDCVLMIVPMYHANAWGLVYSAPAVGAKLVLPGQKLDGASVYELMETEEVTFSSGVPTVWQMLLAHMKETKSRFSTLKRVTVGGSACPESLIRTFHDDYGVEVIQGWGMTETSPLATVSVPNARIAKLPFDGQVSFSLKQGRLLAGLELKVVNESGKRLPHDGSSMGRLKIKGATIAKGYFGGEGGEVLDAEGFLDTGDIATIDPDGYMQITDRAKDVIKSGGEWISSIEVENIAMGHPKVALAAVIGIAHPKWDERPLLIIEPKKGEAPSKEEILEFLKDRIARWWMPDDVVFVDALPLGSTGKLDKRGLRDRFKNFKAGSEA